MLLWKRSEGVLVGWLLMDIDEVWLEASVSVNDEGISMESFLATNEDGYGRRTWLFGEICASRSTLFSDSELLANSDEAYGKKHPLGKVFDKVVPSRGFG